MVLVTAVHPRSGGMAPGTAPTNNAHGLRRAVDHGMGLAILPDYVIPKETRLIQILTDTRMPEIEAYFAYAEELRDSKRLIVFRDFLVSQARSWSF
jgi:DNA-binding transcriptional LysR family regulator